MKISKERILVARVSELEEMLVRRGVCPRCEEHLLMAHEESGKLIAAKCCKCSIVWGNKDEWAGWDKASKRAQVLANTIINLRTN
jgi:hypothetical protein